MLYNNFKIVGQVLPELFPNIEWIYSLIYNYAWAKFISKWTAYFKVLREDWVKEVIIVTPFTGIQFNKI